MTAYPDRMAPRLMTELDRIRRQEREEQEFDLTRQQDVDVRIADALSHAQPEPPQHG